MFYLPDVDLNFDLLGRTPIEKIKDSWLYDFGRVPFHASSLGAGSSYLSTNFIQGIRTSWTFTEVDLKCSVMWSPFTNIDWVANPFSPMYVRSTRQSLRESCGRVTTVTAEYAIGRSSVRRNLLDTGLHVDTKAPQFVRVRGTNSNNQFKGYLNFIMLALAWRDEFASYSSELCWQQMARGGVKQVLEEWDMSLRNFFNRNDYGSFATDIKYHFDLNRDKLFYLGKEVKSMNYAETIPEFYKEKEAEKKMSKSNSVLSQIFEDLKKAGENAAKVSASCKATDAILVAGARHLLGKHYPAFFDTKLGKRIEPIAISLVALAAVYTYNTYRKGEIPHKDIVVEAAKLTIEGKLTALFDAIELPILDFYSRVGEQLKDEQKEAD